MKIAKIQEKLNIPYVKDILLIYITVAESDLI